MFDSAKTLFFRFVPAAFPFFGARKQPLAATRNEMLEAKAYVDPSRLISAGLFIPYNPSVLATRKGLSIFDAMKRDEQVKASLYFKKRAVLAPGWEVVSPADQDEDWEVTEFVRDALVHVQGGWNKALQKFMLGLDYGYCLHGDTLVHTLGGDFPIRDLVGQKPWVFSWDGERVRLAQARRVWKSRIQASCVRVTYKWVSVGVWKTASIVCTANHPFMLLDGTYCEAGKLDPDDRLMPFSQKTFGRAYIQTRRGYGKTCWERRSHWVLKELGFGVEKGCHAHHKNENKLDDRPENLDLLPASEHVANHSRSWFENASAQELAARIEKIKKTRAQPEVRAVLSRAATEANLRTWKDPIVRARRSKGIKNAWASADREKWGKAISKGRRLDNHRVLSVEFANRADVYDMEVPDFHNFAANCVVVHNSISEKVMAPLPSGKLGLAKLISCKPHYFDFNTDAHGQILSVVQRWVQGVNQVEFPPEKFVIYSYDQEFENPYGKSDLEAAYRPWWVKDNAYKWFAIMLERYGMSPLFALYNPNAYPGGQIEELKKVLKNIQNATMGVIPRGTKDDLELWSAQLAQQSKDVFLAALQRFDGDIARAMLVPSMVGYSSEHEGGTGSLARSQTHFDSFMFVVKELQTDIATNAVNAQVVKPLCDLNFPNLTSYPEFKFMTLKEEVKAELFKTWGELVSGKIVNRIEDDETHIRKVFGFPANDAPVLEPLPADALGDKDKLGPDGKPLKPQPQEEEETELRLHAHELCDYKQVASDLDRLEARSLTDLRSVFGGMRDALTTTVTRAYGNESLAKLISDLKLRKRGDLQGMVQEMLRRAWSQGQRDARKEVRKARSYSDPEPFTPSGAIAWLVQKALTISGVLSDRLLGEAKNVLLNGLKNGTPLATMIEQLAAIFDPYVGNADVLEDGLPLPAWRLENIIRTNTTEAYNHARLTEFLDPDLLPFLKGIMYSAVMDERTTEVCRFLDGKIFKPQSPDLASLVPPNHFQCFIDGQVPVLTSRGYREIGALRVGDLVLTHKGRFRRILELHRAPKYSGDVVRVGIKPANRKGILNLTVTPEHPFLIRRANTEMWSRASELRGGDKVVALATRCVGCGNLIPAIEHVAQGFIRGVKTCSKSCGASERSKAGAAAMSEKAKKLRSKHISEGNRRRFLDPEQRRLVARKAHEATRLLVKQGNFHLLSKDNRRKAAVARGKNHLGGSYIEKKVGWLLRSMGLSPKAQYSIPNGNGGRGERSFYVDWALPKDKIVIECDGSAWHKKEHEARDLKRQKKIEDQGWTVLRFSEKAILKNLASVSKEVHAVLANHRGEYEFTEVDVVSTEQRPLRKARTRYNLAVDEDESYIVAGVVVHNCRSIIVPVTVGMQVDAGDFITPAEVGKARELADAKFLSQE